MYVLKIDGGKIIKVKRHDATVPVTEPSKYYPLWVFDKKKKVVTTNLRGANADFF